MMKHWWLTFVSAIFVAIWPSKITWFVLYMFLYSFFSFASVYRGCTFNGSVMRQSLVSPSPQGRGIAGLFHFSIFKALLKAQHCGAKFEVKSLLNAPAPWLTIMTINKWPKSFWISFPSFPLSYGGVTWNASVGPVVSKNLQIYCAEHNTEI